MKFNLSERKIVANLDAFIIPNSVNLFKNFYLKERREAKYKKLLELSGATCDINEQYMVQMWYVGEELNSDNLVDHGFRIIENGTKYSFTMNGFDRLPYYFLKDKKEGDIIKVTFPIELDIDDESENTENWTLEATIKLNQTDYRYRRFGRFEDVLATLIPSIVI